MGALLDRALDALNQALALTPDEKVAAKVDHYEAIIVDISTHTDELQASNADLVQLVSSLEAQKVDLESALADAQEIANDLATQYNKLPEVPADQLTVVSDLGKAKINHGVEFKGKIYTPADLANEPDVVEQLLSMNSSSVTLLED